MNTAAPGGFVCTDSVPERGRDRLGVRAVRSVPAVAHRDDRERDERDAHRRQLAGPRRAGAATASLALQCDRRFFGCAAGGSSKSAAVRRCHAAGTAGASTFAGAAVRARPARASRRSAADDDGATGAAAAAAGGTGADAIGASGPTRDEQAPARHARTRPVAARTGASASVSPAAASSAPAAQAASASAWDRRARRGLGTRRQDHADRRRRRVGTRAGAIPAERGEDGFTSSAKGEGAEAASPARPAAASRPTRAGRGPTSAAGRPEASASQRGRRRHRRRAVNPGLRIEQRGDVAREERLERRLARRTKPESSGERVLQRHLRFRRRREPGAQIELQRAPDPGLQLLGKRLVFSARRARARPASSAGTRCGYSSSASGRPRTSASAVRPIAVTSAR
jgi:hypothetical protein